MFSDGEPTFGPRKVGGGFPQVRAEFRGRFRGTGGDFRGPVGRFRGPGQFRHAMADRFHLNENALLISAQR